MRSPALLKNAARLLALGLLGCTGSYEVGQMDKEPVVSVGGTNAGSGGSRGVSNNNQAGSPEEEALAICEPGQPPPALTGPFAEPNVVWERISNVLSITPTPPPSDYPPTTTYDWAGDIVAQAFSQAADAGQPAPGAEDFVQRFLRMPKDAEPLSVDWGKQLLSNMPTLEVLLLTQLPSDARRTGIFTEPAWLKQFPQIPTRGYVIATSALGATVIPEPGDITTRQNPNPGELTSRRQAENTNLAVPACAGCHQLVDPLGFSLEHFDGLGNYQETDGSKPVDSAGSYRVAGTSRDIVFDNNVNLSQQLVYVCEANLGMASSYLNIALERSHVDAENRTATHDANLKRFQQAYVGNGRSYRALVTAWAQSHIVLDP